MRVMAQDYFNIPGKLQSKKLFAPAQSGKLRLPGTQGPTSRLVGPAP